MPPTLEDCPVRRWPIACILQSARCSVVIQHWIKTNKNSGVVFVKVKVHVRTGTRHLQNKMAFERLNPGLPKEKNTIDAADILTFTASNYKPFRLR
jgi:hypothetical protein